MQKQSTTASTAPKSGLVEQLTALLSSDELPEELYNPLAETLHELAGQARVTLLTPEVLRVALPLILDRLASADAEARGLGATPATSIRPANSIRPASNRRPSPSARAA